MIYKNNMPSIFLFIFCFLTLNANSNTRKLYKADTYRSTITSIHEAAHCFYIFKYKSMKQYNLRFLISINFMNNNKPKIIKYITNNVSIDNNTKSKFIERIHNQKNGGITMSVEDYNDYETSNTYETVSTIKKSLAGLVIEHLVFKRFNINYMGPSCDLQDILNEISANAKDLIDYFSTTIHNNKIKNKAMYLYIKKSLFHICAKKENSLFFQNPLLRENLLHLLTEIATDMETELRKNIELINTISKEIHYNEFLSLEKLEEIYTAENKLKKLEELQQKKE